MPKRNYDTTIPELAARAGVTVEEVEEAITNSYLVPCMVRGERGVKWNILSMSYVHHAGNITHLKRWTGKHGKPVKTINKISIRAVTDMGREIFACYLPDGRAYSLPDRTAAEEFARDYPGEWIRRQTGNVEGAGLGVTLTGDELLELILCLPATDANKRLRRKLTAALEKSRAKRDTLRAQRRTPRRAPGADAEPR